MYGFSTTVNANMADTKSRVIEALSNESFGIITEINMAEKFREKLGVEHKGYEVLGACNPALAHQAVQQEADIGLLLPCNVLLREVSANETVVAFLDPAAMFSLVGRDEIAPLAEDVKARLMRVKDALNA